MSRNTYVDLNAELNLYAPDGSLQLHKDKESARAYFNEYVNTNTRFFHDIEEKIEYLTANNHWDKKTLSQYDANFVKKSFKQAYDHKFRFPSFMGAYKFYTSYALKSDDGQTILERYEDRVVMCALHLAQGDKKMASNLIDEIITGRYQPATPTFQNSGKARGGEQVSCFLLLASDSLDSIKDTWAYAAQLSKLGGGVAINMTNIRERGAPLKGKKGLAKGVISWMKIYEDIFTTVDQLGTRQGAGAVYLNVHHPDIMQFLDSKAENADEKMRIKTLSTGVVIPDITMRLARSGEDMYMFSPYDVERVYGTPFAEIDITEKYQEMVDNPEITKTKMPARKLLEKIAQLQFESGYPYILFSGHANRANPLKGTINMSNLCSEILQINSPSVYDDKTGKVKQVGMDISCNLGSMNVYNAMQAPDFAKTVDTAMRALTAVSDMTSIDRVPTVKKANEEMHSVGLGQMSLATYFATNEMIYGDADSLDFTNNYFMAVNYYSLLSSCKIAQERDIKFKGFEDSSYATGEYFSRYVDGDEIKPTSKKVEKLFAKSGVNLPTQSDWEELKKKVMKHGLYHSYRMAIPPTGSISYINNASASIHPITSLIEIRKEGSLGRVYYPTPHLSKDNMEFFKDAYEVGPNALIDVYAEANKHVDQGLSLTVFMKETATTRDVNRAQIYAYSKGIRTIYYLRLRAVNSDMLDGLNVNECVSCAL